MSTIKTNTLTGTTSAGSILVTGEGGSTTTNLQQGLCKGWASVQLDDTVMDNLNLTTFTDNGVGDITHNFVNPMGNINFVSIGGNIRNNDGGVAWCGGYGSDSEADIKKERERGITTANLLDRTGISLAWFLKLKPMLLDLCPSITYDKKERKFYYDYSLSLSLFPKGSLYIYPLKRE